MYRIALLIALLAALVVPVAGARTTDTTLSLVAYSTPKAAFATIIPAFQKTPAGKGVNFTQSYGAVGRPGAGGRRTACPPTSSTSRSSPTCRRSSRPASSRRTGTRTRTRASSRARSSCSSSATGNPKHIRSWNDLIKPGVAGADAEPVHLGRRALERPRRVRRAAQARARRRSRPSDVPRQALPARRRAGQVGARRAEHVPRRQGRRAAHVRERGDRSRSAAASRVDYIIPKATILIDNPIAVTTTARTRRRRRRSSTFLYTPAAQKIFARERLPAGRCQGATDRASASRCRRGCSRSTTSAAGRRSTKKFFDPNTGLDGEDRAEPRRLDWLARRSRAAPAARAERRAGAARRSAAASSSAT